MVALMLQVNVSGKWPDLLLRDALDMPGDDESDGRVNPAAHRPPSTQPPADLRIRALRARVLKKAARWT